MIKQVLVIISTFLACATMMATPDNATLDSSDKDDSTGSTLAQQLDIQKTGGDTIDWLADVASRIQIHGYAQGWYYFQNAGGKRSNSFLCKRTVFWVNAKITERWSFQFMHDFNSVVQEYFTDFRITRNNALTIRFGQFKHGLSYENPLSPTAMETIDVYSEGVTYLTGCGSDPLNGVQYGREQGLAFLGETNTKFLKYELDILNGSGINVKDKDNNKIVVGRIELHPTNNLTLCATGQIGKGTSLVSAPIFNHKIAKDSIYTRNSFTIGFNIKTESFGLHGEFLTGKDADVTSRGAYLTGSGSIVPGKWDLVGSYDYFNFNTDNKCDMHKVVAGFQYWFFKRCRFQMQYVYKSANTDYKTFFNNGRNGTKQENCHALMCQMQVRFN